MKYRTVTERVGELLGPVDWSYGFRTHFDGYCTDAAGRDVICKQHVDRLRKIVENKDDYEVTTYGGWPRCGWGIVIAVGMYDGWPYWKPVPSVLFRSTIGSEWTGFANITNIRNIKTGEIE